MLRLPRAASDSGRFVNRPYAKPAKLRLIKADTQFINDCNDSALCHPERSEAKSKDLFRIDSSSPDGSSE
jgi:hypothetical protein